MNGTILLATAPERPPRNETTLRDRSPFSGARVANLNPALAEELSRNYEQREVIVLAVRRGSPARRIGLKPGDIIVEINHMRIRSVRDLKNALQMNDREWAIAVRRKGRVLRTTIRR
jgi:serine protease Do